MIREIDADETALAYEAMLALRTHLADEQEFAERVNDVQRREGYRLVGAFDGDRVVGVAGFRVGHNLAWGKFLYVDDLSTLPEARRKGHASALLDWCAEEAKRLGCDQLHLDSGVGIERADAHRLYLQKRMVISSHHFARPVDRG
jgi:GNAT superfamily N-acetyltransferase